MKCFINTYTHIIRVIRVLNSYLDFINQPVTHIFSSRVAYSTNKYDKVTWDEKYE